MRIGAIRNPNLAARRVGETRLVCCASPAYLAAHGTPATPADLARHACPTYEHAPVRSQWRFVDANGAEQIAKVAVARMHGDNGEMLAALAAQGAGVTLEPDFIVEPLIASGRLVPILVGYEVPPIPIHAAHPSRRHLSAKVRAFIDHLRCGRHQGRLGVAPWRTAAEPPVATLPRRQIAGERFGAVASKETRLSRLRAFTYAGHAHLPCIKQGVSRWRSCLRRESNRE